MISNTSGDPIKGFSTPVVSRLTGVPPGTLNHWVATGLIIPEVRGPSGRRATRFWSSTDLVAVRAIRELRDLGCPLQTLRAVRAKLQREGGDFSNRVLVWDSRDVLEIASWREVRSLIKRPGQRVLAPIVLSLEQMMRQATLEVEVEGELVDRQRLSEATEKRAELRKARMPVIDFSTLSK